MSKQERDTLPSGVPPRVFYQVVSTVRKPTTRMLRAASPVHHRLKQYLFNGSKTPTRRLVRNRAVVITEAELKLNLKELQDKCKAGILEVRTMSGRLVNLKDMSVAPEKPVPPLPHPPLDSVANDVPAGVHEPMFMGGATIIDPAADQVAAELAERKREEFEDLPSEGASNVSSEEQQAAFEDPAQEAPEEAGTDGAKAESASGQEGEVSHREGKKRRR